MNRTDEVSSELVDDIQPARAAAYQLQAALRDQETALRGYAIAADRLFLQPYYDGQRTEWSAADEVRSWVGYRRDAIDDLDAIERAAANWRRPTLSRSSPASRRAPRRSWPMRPRSGAGSNSTVCERYSTCRTQTWQHLACRA
jgi:hypothetical protein